MCCTMALAILSIARVLCLDDTLMQAGWAGKQDTASTNTSQESTVWSQESGVKSLESRVWSQESGVQSPSLK